MSAQAFSIIEIRALGEQLPGVHGAIGRARRRARLASGASLFAVVDLVVRRRRS